MKPTFAIASLALALTAGGGAYAQSSGDAVPVTADNFVRAESDLYFGNVVMMEVSASSLTIAT